jgi:cupin fold WbuC family metalloprotein
MSEPKVVPSVQFLDDALIERTILRARSSPRLRANYNFHPTHEDPTHRFLNVFLRGTYVAPHRHIEIPKPEAFLVLRGELVCFLFDEAGKVEGRHVLGRGGVLGIDLPPGTWHTLAPATEVAVCYEVKPGPWDPATDKEFAPWAPREGEPGTADYLATLMAGI